MRKNIVIFSIACACATGAFADHGANEQWQNPWFNAIGNNATTTSLDPTNGTWTLPESGYEIKNKKLVLNQDGVADPASFAIGDDYEVDESTIVEVKSKVQLYPVLANDLSVPDNTKKVAFAVVKEGSALTYRAWVDGQSKWTTLSDLGTAKTDEEVSVLIQLNYRTGVATFSVNGTTSGTTIAIPANTANPSGFSIAGCSTVASVDGEVQYNVASYDGKGYATIQDAVDAVEVTSGQETQPVTVLRETDENVSITKDGVVIDGDGKVKGEIEVADNVQVDLKPTYDEMEPQGTIAMGESGQYTFPCKVKGDGTVEVVLPSEMEPYKEVVPGKIVTSGTKVTVDIRTKDSILDAAKESVQDLGGLETNDDLRDYLTTNLQAYVAAEANYTDIAAGLTNVAKAVSEGGNGFALYETFLLNIAPDAKVGIVTPPAGDTATDAIGISFPFPIRSQYSDTYDIRYKFGDGDVWTQVDKSTNIIPVPLATGTYKISIKLTLGAR